MLTIFVFGLDIFSKFSLVKLLLEFFNVQGSPLREETLISILIRKGLALIFRQILLESCLFLRKYDKLTLVTSLMKLLFRSKDLFEYFPIFTK